MRIALVGVLSVLAWCPGVADAEAISVYPARAEGFVRGLGGEWAFKYIPALDVGADGEFAAPSFDVSTWKKIAVPANWELQGFAEPHYALELKDGLGLYRRTFTAPANWRDGRRVFLRFDGVAFGFEAWVNGKQVGQSVASAYNATTLDVTDALLPDAAAENVLAVRVTTKPLGFEFDVNDDWALCGIYRDVTLFSVPATHIDTIATQTRLRAGGTAELTVDVTLSDETGEVRGKLFGPGGELARDMSFRKSDRGRHQVVALVEQPKLWTAETPALYRLQLTTIKDGQPLQTVEERIGLREITIADGVLLLNGRPIKLRGVNHHDLDPQTGRAITEAQMRRDLELMKKGNINFVRTSHYPPQAQLIELCDEMGLYVMCEVAIGRGEAHLDDPRYHDNIMNRVEPTITRDRNRPSVIVWSIGNENPVSAVEMEACRRAKELDPSRPICLPKIGSYFEKNYGQIPDYVDIYSPHYPSNAMLRSFAKNLNRPTIFTEYAHALGLATDRIQEQWDIMQSTPQFAGGAIWHFMDQGILRTSEKPVDLTKATDYAWVDQTHFYDTHGGDGTDGIVYSDRTPQSDFWQARKVYAPVQIAEKSATVKPGKQDVSITVENRYDFRSLEGIKLSWALLRNGQPLELGVFTMPRIAPHARDTIRIPLNIPSDLTDDILALSLYCDDETSMRVTEHVVRLKFDDAPRDAWPTLALSPAPGKPTVSDSEKEIVVTTLKWTLTVTRPAGELTIRDPAGKTLVAGIYPHPGRKLTMTEGRSAGRLGLWRTSTITQLTEPSISVTQQDAAVTLKVSGRYARPDATDEALVGGYEAVIAPSGAIAISYDYVPTNAKGKFAEAGLSVVVPSELAEFRWIGQGIYPGYPGKDRLNDFGIFHLQRDDARFQGNRRETEFAMLTTADGAGVAIAAAPSDIAVERAGNQLLLSHNAVIGGLGNKGTPPELTIDVDKTPHLAGKFTLLPLENNWPQPVLNWFGKPVAAKDVFRPFYHSYDQ